ncbi:MAG: secretin N-terminal domain-containing protein [Phycisphaerae bacterium]|nr:secretin N-terminal domain-containing protein [Tepidisphaeraceae bacterium]
MPERRRRPRSFAISPVARWVAAGLVGAVPGVAFAQPAPAPAPAGARVTMDFPADGVDVRVLADVVSKRLKIPIIYDDAINNKKVIVRAPVDLPESALMGILESALRMKQLALVDGDQPGWKQIVPATNMAALAKPVGAEAQGAATPVVQVVQLKHADSGRVADAVRPFLTPQGGSVAAVAGLRAVVVTDYPSVIGRVEQIARSLDEAAPVDVRFVTLKNAEPQQALAVVQQILAGRDGGGGAPAAAGGGAATGGAAGVTLIPDERTGQIIVIAPKARAQDVADLIAGVDKPLELATKVYRLKQTSPERIDRLVKNLIGAAAAKRGYQSTIDREAQLLVVSASEDVHTRIDALIKDLDAPVAEAEKPVKFYKLKNAKAADVLSTIAALTGDTANVAQPAGGTGDAGGYGQPLLGAPGGPSDNRLMTPGTQSSMRGGPTGAVLNPTSPLAAPAAMRPRTDDLGPLADVSRGGGMTGGGMTGSGALNNAATGPMRGTGAGGENGDDPTGAGGARKNATVAADVNTNSIIVIGPPAVQDMYASLIARLDVRRPQVQVECTIVTLDTTDNFSFGVDIGHSGGVGNSSIISFGSFGIASVNPTTGALTPVRSPGGTFALLTPGITDVVVRALSQSSKARLISAPRLLVNDNGKGRLQSVSQEPFAEILDTSTTQSRTGLGGLAQAGTTISIEPHISDDDYLQLAYSIELSSFTGTGRQGLPPPSQKNSVDSAVTIPDGHTIVVGGLRVKNFRSGMDSLPIIDQIPVLNWLIGSRSSASSDLTLFVFIRPVILRDEKFEDLKYVSDAALKDVGLPGQYPSSKPIAIK